MANVNDIKNLYLQGTQVSALYLGDIKLWPTGLPVGTVYNFDYTGNVQSVELPPGKYKLQCWGAQGGTSYGDSNGVGSKGGYSEGVLTLNETTTLYVFVGGEGSNGSSRLLVNGGWNGGGASVGYSSYSSSGIGESWPACGGGATDICTVTSSMSYSSGITNRSSESLLSRIIVAGGGAGGSSCTSTYDTTSTLYNYIGDFTLYWESDTLANYKISNFVWEVGKTYVILGSHDSNASSENTVIAIGLGSNDSEYRAMRTYLGSNFTINTLYTINVAYFSVGMKSKPIGDHTYTLYEVEYTTTSTTSSGCSNQSGCGGGTNGGGCFYGTQTSAGKGDFSGGFGYGASQTATNYKFCSGGAGGGWYGGGAMRTDSNSEYISMSGGGSGFVNTAANSSYRPSGYTGLQLDSGTTIAGDTPHSSISGGVEIGHSGNGYAKIIALDSSGNSSGGNTTASISWVVQTGNWIESFNSSAKDGIQFTSVSPGSSGSTRLMCAFSGVTSITFNCVYNGESNYDYLTVGALDSTCTRDSYGTTLKGTSGTAKDITFSCDSGTHYVEFCYSKDGNVDTSPDCAVVYVKSYS